MRRKFIQIGSVEMTQEEIAEESLEEYWREHQAHKRLEAPLTADTANAPAVQSASIDDESE